jgi:hypothetical protein
MFFNGIYIHCDIFLPIVANKKRAAFFLLVTTASGRGANRCGNTEISVIVPPLSLDKFIDVVPDIARSIAKRIGGE